MELTKVRKGTFQHIESELYNLEDTKKDLMRIRNEILNRSSQPNETGIRGSLPSDPTGLTATILLTNRVIEEAEKVINAIESVHSRLPVEKQQLMKIKYWTRPQTLTWDGIALKMDISRATAIRWRDEVIYAVADVLGWR